MSYHTATTDQASNIDLFTSGPPVCNNGEIRIVNATRISFPSSRSSVTGRVETCINGRFVDLCSNANYSTVNISRIACEREGIYNGVHQSKSTMHAL